MSSRHADWRSPLALVLLPALLLACDGNKGAAKPPTPDPTPTATAAPDSGGDSGDSAGAGSKRTLVFVGRITAEDIEIGTGRVPEKWDQCAVEYEMRLTDGTLVSRTAPGETFTFQMGSVDVIEGWMEGMKARPKDKLEAMRVGGKRKLLIPGLWAYGHPDWAKPIPDNVKKTDTIALVFKLVRIGDEDDEK